MYCKNCGMKLPDWAHFCERCGARVGLHAGNGDPIDRVGLDDTSASEPLWPAEDGAASQPDAAAVDRAAAHMAGGLKTELMDPSAYDGGRGSHAANPHNAGTPGAPRTTHAPARAHAAAGPNDTELMAPLDATDPDGTQLMTSSDGAYHASAHASGDAWRLDATDPDGMQLMTSSDGAHRAGAHASSDAWRLDPTDSDGTQLMDATLTDLAHGEAEPEDEAWASADARGDEPIDEASEAFAQEDALAGEAQERSDRSSASSDEGAADEDAATGTRGGSSDEQAYADTAEDADDEATARSHGDAPDDASDEADSNSASDEAEGSAAAGAADDADSASDEAEDSADGDPDAAAVPDAAADPDTPASDYLGAAAGAFPYWRRDTYLYGNEPVFAGDFADDQDYTDADGAPHTVGMNSAMRHRSDAEWRQRQQQSGKTDVKSTVAAMVAPLAIALIALIAGYFLLNGLIEVVRTASPSIQESAQPTKSKRVSRGDARKIIEGLEGWWNTGRTFDGRYWHIEQGVIHTYAADGAMVHEEEIDASAIEHMESGPGGIEGKGYYLRNVAFYQLEDDPDTLYKIEQDGSANEDANLHRTEEPNFDEEPAKEEEKEEDPYADDFILPDSSTRIYDRAELDRLNNYDLWIAYNEIYARAGYKFNPEGELGKRFYEMEWYQPRDDFQWEDFNEVERENTSTMYALEQERGSEYLY